MAPARSWASWLDQVAAETVFVLDESGGFAEVDPWWVSLLGDSPFWTRWRLQALDVTDLWESGTPALRPPPDLVTVPRLADATQGGPLIDLRLAPSTVPRGSAAWQHGRVGDLWPPAHAIMGALSGAHARDRALRPTSDRPHLRDPLRITASGPAGDGVVFTDAWAGARRFPVFAAIVSDTVAAPLHVRNEDEAFASVRSGWTDETGRRGVMFDVAFREHRGLELWRLPEQTTRRLAAAAGGWMPLRRWQIGLLLQGGRDQAPVTDYVVDLHDPDGQQTEPWRLPVGTVAGLRLQARGRVGVVALDPMLDLLLFQPQARLRAHPLFFEGRPYGRVVVRSRRRVLGRPSLAAHWSQAVVRRAVSVETDIGGITTALLQSGGNALGLADWEAGLALSWGHGRFRRRPFLHLRKVAVPPDPFLQRRLTPGLTDSDILRDTSAGTELERTTGGGSIDVPPFSDLPDVYAIALGLELPVRRWWRFRVVGAGKVYTDLWRLDFDGSPADYGYTVSDVFYYRDGPTRYRLKHARRDPGVYYGAHMQWLGERPGVFRFAWTFSAYNVIGRPVPGNGPLANDLAVIDEAGASPNARIHERANLDVDRAFNTKIAAAVPIWKPVWLWLFLTHYDGTPFTFYDVYEHDGQVAWVANQHRGSPFTFVGPLIGAREDFRLNLDVRVEATIALRRVRMRLWSAAWNLLDFSNELVEMQSRAGRDGRLTLIQEIPRAIEIGIELSAQ